MDCSPAGDVGIKKDAGQVGHEGQVVAGSSHFGSQSP